MFLKKLKSKKGMNAVETAILVIILLMLVIIYIDVLRVSQQMSAATSATNYIARTIERQGGLLDYVPTNFATYGHGSYTTSKNAYAIIEQNLEKVFGEDCIGNNVEIKITLVQSDPDSVKKPHHGTEVFELKDNSCFGVYLKGGTYTSNDPGFISAKSLKYYKPYYIVEVTMKYNMWIVPTVVTAENLAIKDIILPDEPNYNFKQTFTRVVIPSYYIQEEYYDQTQVDNDNFFVV